MPIGYLELSFCGNNNVEMNVIILLAKHKTCNTAIIDAPQKTAVKGQLYLK
jgi:hypothetical protein